MALLQWRDEYEIGIRSVDHEHHALIGVINLLGDHLDPKDGVAGIREALGEILTLIATHFAHEETIMRDLHYDQFAAHKADHERLLTEIREILRGIDPGAAVDCRVQLGDRIGRWFSRHFESFDSRLHTLIDGPGLKMRE